MTAGGAWASARGQLYRYLASAFLRPPTEAFVAPFLDQAVLDELESRFGPGPVAALRAFRETFRAEYDALDQEYQQLFVVPLGRYVTPYEAVYRDERPVEDGMVRGLLMGPSTLAVTQLYRDAGLDVAEGILELPDHVGLELACMDALCALEARAAEREDGQALEGARALQRRLLEDHLLRWVPSLCARVRANAPGPFYRGIATLTEAFLRQESDELAAARPDAGPLPAK